MVLPAAEVEEYCKQNPEIKSVLILLQDDTLIRLESIDAE